MNSHSTENCEAPTFTGERVIPGEVEPDLWNEHVSRYQLAALFAAGKAVLDVGCGTGYGTALLMEQAASATGFDIAPEAVEFAAKHYGGRAKFLTGSADDFPADDRSCDVVTAFEVIEHISEWQRLIEEASRVLREDGVFLVSTPNTIYQAEARAQIGRNPFHVHEFEYGEFRQALERVFPYVTILAQNHQEAIVFGCQGLRRGNAFIERDPIETDAHYFLAICGKKPVELAGFAYVPRAGNMLWERERHIALLEKQVADAREQHLLLLDEHRRAESELERQNEWALRLERELGEARLKITAEQDREHERAREFQTALDELERDKQEKAEWARLANEELRAKSDELVRTVELLTAANEQLKERTEWAKKLEEEARERTAWAQSLEAELEERTIWARDLEVRLNERTAWAQGLEAELNERTSWARDLEAQLNERTAWAQRLEAELEERSGWAQRMDAELADRTRRATDLEAEMEHRIQRVRDLESDLKQRTDWAFSLEQKLRPTTEKLSEFERCRLALDGLIEEIQEENRKLHLGLHARKASTMSLREQFAVVGKLADALLHERELVRNSKWIRLGRILQVGPVLGEDPPV